MIYQMRDCAQEELLVDTFSAVEHGDHYESGDPALEHDELHQGDDWGPEFDPGLDSPTDFDEYESNYDDCGPELDTFFDDFN